MVGERVRGSLSFRMALASGLLVVIVGAAFGTMLLAITNLLDSTQSRSHTRQELVAADGLEKLVIDLETGIRGFVITGRQRFLDPWTQARIGFPNQARQLERLVSGNPVQLRRVQRIVQATTSYVRDYSVPLVAAVRRHDPSARSVARTDDGRRRIDALREAFETFRATGRADLAARESSANVAGRRALVGAGVGVAGSTILILLFSGYLTRVIVRPVRRAASMADQLASGDLSARMSESGPGEIGTLEQSFNVMADSLERSRDELASSRARIVATADETRRRIERDLHDGAQQRLVSLALELRAAQAAVPEEAGELEAELSRVADGLASVLDDLREIARGIHPAILAEGGLGPALNALARRSAVPVEVDLRTAPHARLPQQVEVAAYYVVAEALTNAAKHAGASTVVVRAEADDSVLRLSIRDDGNGGADPTAGSGLIGLRDRVEAIAGTLVIESTVGSGTTLLVELPLRAS
jgi:signal transduction histidine kinase